MQLLVTEAQHNYIRTCQEAAVDCSDSSQICSNTAAIAYLAKAAIFLYCKCCVDQHELESHSDSSNISDEAARGDLTAAA